MSYIYLQGLEEVSSEDYCWDTDPCALLKSSHIREEYYSSGSETGFCQDSRSGTMCEPLMENHGEEKLTLSAEGSRARISVQREEGRESQGSVQDCGVRCKELYVMLDLVTFSWKTAHCLLEEDLHWSSVILPRWGMMLNGVCWEVTPPEGVTTGNGFGSWLPTPNASDHRDRGDFSMESVKRREMIGKQIGLSTYFKGRPCPTCVERIMGWPTQWTGLKPLEMAKIREWRNLHGN